MATLYKRQNGVYYLKFRLADGREIRKSTGTTVRKLALRIKAETEAELYTGKAPCSDVLGFADAWNIYSVALTPHKKMKTIYNEGREWTAFATFCESLGVTTLQSLKVGDVARYQAALASGGRSTIGINTSLRAVKSTVNHLIRLQAFSGPNPFLSVRPLPEQRGTKFLQWDIVQGLVRDAKAHGRDTHLAFILGAYAGLRKGEILAARWEHVDWGQGRMWIEGTKTSASRDYVPLHQTLRDALAEYRQDEGLIVAPDHPTLRGMHGYRWGVNYAFSKVTADVTPHMLRHSVATHLLDIGYTLQQVAVFLRHASDIPTRRYADLKGVKLDMDKF